MKPSIYPIVAEYPGQLFIMPKPSGEWLEEDIQYYRSMGVDLIVSMLEHDEAIELLLNHEQIICFANGLNFVHLPTPDRGLPEKKEFMELISLIRKRLGRNEGIAVHCRAGIGRSGILVCSVLAGFVGSVTKSIEIVSAARGVQVPDTAGQLQFIEDIVRELGTR
ncbi:protein-tyrosine phosphatase family protein [uncultured Jannaschia sp.]|uniref:protein-tyrosine phosphatase family protein n=1 Tax=uncultured Jannaschia sp. TaxID=293347 RepID=UPI0026254C70|nr:protein-tyrosine phosphatase family protein [uncultured Jannaschia sp.]